MKRLNTLTSWLLVFVLTFQTMFFSLPMSAAASSAPETSATATAVFDTGILGSLGDSTTSPSAPPPIKPKEPVVETNQTAAWGDFSEGLTKGIGFKLSRPDGAFVDFRLEDAPPAMATTLDNTTLFSLPGEGSVKYTSTPNKVKEEIVLNARPLADKLAFSWSSSGLVPFKNANGGFSLHSGGESAFEITPPTVVDAKGNAGQITLDITEDQATLSIDSAFLDKAAYPITIDPSVVATLNNGGAGLTSERNTFYDPYNGHNKYWVLYSDGTNIRSSYSSSGDSGSWTQASGGNNPTVNSGTYFSTYYDGTYIYAAYRKSSGYSIMGRRGTVSSTNISWDASEYTVFTGSSSTNYYMYPSISQASGGKLWVGARYYNGTYYTIRAKRSTNASSVSSWEATEHVVSGNSSGDYLIPQILPLGSDMYALWLHNTEIRGKKYDYATNTWINAVSISGGTADLSHIPSAVVKSGVIYIGYSTSGNTLYYRTLSSPYSTLSGASSLANGETGADVALTLNGSSVYAFYATPPGSSEKMRFVTVGDPNTKIFLSAASGSGVGWDQVVAPYSCSNSYVTWRQNLSGANGIYFSRNNVGLPTTSLSINPTTPNGDNGWYKTTTPTVTLTANPLSGGTAWYNWNSLGWSSGSSPLALTNAPQGTDTLSCYSIDAYGNVGGTTEYQDLIKVDTVAPTNPTLTSPSHTVDTTSYDNTIDINLSGASDTTSGLDGYSVEWSQSAGTTPDTTVDLGVGATSTVSPPLAGGAWYFHLKTKDIAGNWSSAVHLGPFNMAAGLTGLEVYSTPYVKSTKAANLTVNLANGNIIAQVAGLSRPARGLPVAITHTYNSREATDSPFGFGWSINYARRLDTADPSVSVTYFDEDLSRHLFPYDSSTSAYKRPPGVFLTLIKNGDGTFTLTDKAQVKSNFDASGKLTSVVDRNANTVCLTYTSGQLTKITDGSGADTTLGYTSGRLSQVTTADGRTNTYGYNGSGDLASIKNAADTTSSIFSYTNHWMTGITDALSRTTSLGYTNNRVTAITDPAPLSYQTTFSYDGTSTVVDGPRTDVGDVTTFTFNTSGLLASLAEPSPGGVTTYGYDSDLNLTSITKPNTAHTTYTYDTSGNRMSQTDPLNHITYSAYNANNDLLNTTDALGYKTTYSYDTTGNLTNKINADDTSETYVNDQYGQQTKVTNPRGYDTDYTYTNLGLVDEERQDGGTVVTRHEYDLAGNETTTTDPLQYKTIQSYDVMGQLLSTKAPDGGRTYSEYDAVGNKLKESRLADLQIADMEADEIWTGATTDTGNFKQGVQGRKVTSANGVLGLMSKSLSLNLAGEDATSGYIDQWVYVDDVSVLDTVAIQISFDSTAGSSYSYQVPKTGLSNGWNFFHLAKTDFSPSGSPTWGVITGVANSARSVLGQTANVTFEDLRLVGNKRKLGSLSYDEMDRLTTSTDALGNASIFTYDPAGNKLSETDSKGTTSYTYDALSYEATVTDPNNNPTANSYDSVGNLISVQDTNPDHNPTTYAYDIAGHQISEIDPEGNFTSYTYDRLGTKISEGIDSVSVADFEADETWVGGATDTATYREGHQSRQLFGASASMYRNVSLDLSVSDHFNLLVSINSTDNMSGLDVVFYTGTATASRHYAPTDFSGIQSDGWQLKNINKSEFTISGGFSWANITKVSLATTGNSSLVVNFDGLSLGDRILNRYDKSSHLTGVNDKNGSLTAYQYDQNGNQTRITPPQSSTSGDTTNTYDQLDRLLASTDGAGKTTSHAYDLAGRETTTTLPTGTVKLVEYDEASKLLSVTAPDSTTTYVYDTQGNKIVQQRIGSLNEYFTYDDAGRLLKTVNSDGRIKADNLDVKGSSTYVIDKNGRVDYNYDAGSRLTDMKIEGETSTTYGYDANSNRTAFSQANGMKTAYGYDDDSRLSSIETSKTGAQLFNMNYGYDEQGNITTETVNGGGIAAYGYDANDQLTNWSYDGSADVDYQANSLPASSTPAWTRSYGGSPTQSASGGILTTTAPYLGWQQYTKAEANLDNARGTTLEARIKIDSSNGLNDFSNIIINDGAKNLDFSIFKNRVRLENTNYYMDTTDDYHVYRITLIDGVAVLYVDGTARINLSYVSITSEKLVRFGDEGEAMNTWAVYWDYLRYSTSGAFAPGRSAQYAYDANGNRTLMTSADGTTTYVYGADNRLVSSTLASQTTTYTYDDNGNLSQKAGPGGTYNYTWNSKNELIHASGPSLESTYTYDAEGKRTSKTANGSTAQFVYDGIKLIQQKDSVGNIIVKYFYDDKGQLVSMQKDGHSYFFHLNHRGDVVKITDEWQEVLASYEYDPWGNMLSYRGSFTQPFRYASYYWDSEIGMYYLMARYYDPVVGRFVSKDPAGDPENDIGTATQVNRYLYANNNPIKYVDPDGAFAIEIVVTAGAVVAMLGFAAYIMWLSQPDTQQAISSLQDALEKQARAALRLLVKTVKDINGWTVRVEQHKKGKVHAHWKKHGKKGSVNQDGSKHHKKGNTKPPRQVEKWLREKAGFSFGKKLPMIVAPQPPAEEGHCPGL